MVKVRGVYPNTVRLVVLLVMIPLFYTISEWVFQSSEIAVITSLIFVVVLTLTIISDFAPTKFINNVAKKAKTSYRAEDVQLVKAKTISSKWVYNTSVTTLEFRFGDHIPGRLSLTDTRNPFSPVKSGYRQVEVEAILLWLSYVPPTVEGYQHVKHLEDMLRVKHFEEDEGAGEDKSGSCQQH